jgi:hypothetical protein
MGKQGNRIVPKGIGEGDYVLVHWIDITSSHSGDKNKASITPTITGGFWAGFKTSEGVRTLVTRDSFHPKEPEDENYEGYDAYPMSTVKKVQILLKAKDLKWLMSRTG